jgi:hypothetical protein
MMIFPSIVEIIVDLIADHYNLVYAAQADTADRNIADRAMIQELGEILNPTKPEKIERVTVIR